MIVGILLAMSALVSSPELGKAAGQCRPNEAGPAFRVQADGLKDRRGHLKLELYPANDADFLADDNLLVAAGKPFARVEVPVPPSGPVVLCIRAPSPGLYALSLLDDRNSDQKFNLSIDGIGFSNNPGLRWSKPQADAVAVYVGSHPVQLRITLNYRRGLFALGPIAG